MDTLTDQQLLREYAECRHEAAFAELVRRHVDFVYSAAIRMVRDPHIAEDVTQGVFVAFAQNAASLSAHATLSGWLHRTCRNLAANVIRTDTRRRNREQEAVIMNELLAPQSEPVWEQIAPHLDDALAELNDSDRDALFLRYFERKSAHEIAQALGTTDDAAQKRVSRAVERLRELFAKRGLAVGAGGLAAVISANAVQAAPAELSAAISTAAAVAGSTLATTAVATITKTIAMTTIQKTFVVAVIASAVGTGIYKASQAARMRDEVQTLRQQQSPLAGQIEQLQRERDDATNRLAFLTNELARNKSNNAELLKLRNELTRMRSDATSTNDPIQAAAKSWMKRVAQLKQRLEENPNARIPELSLLTEEDWLAAVKDRHLDTDVEYRRALSTLRSAGENAFANEVETALQKYSQAGNTGFPSDFSQLQPYFDSPVDDAILQRWQITSAKTVPNLGFGDTIITQKNAVDDLFDQRFAVGLNGMGSTDFLTSEAQTVIQPVYKAFLSANNQQNPTDPSQLLPYATTPEQQAAVQKLIQRNLFNK